MLFVHDFPNNNKKVSTWSVVFTCQMTVIYSLPKVHKYVARKTKHSTQTDYKACANNYQ